jgi:hypothetical protein
MQLLSCRPHAGCCQQSTLPLPNEVHALNEQKVHMRYVTYSLGFCSLKVRFRRRSTALAADQPQLGCGQDAPAQTPGRTRRERPSPLAAQTPGRTRRERPSPLAAQTPGPHGRPARTRRERPSPLPGTGANDAGQAERSRGPERLMPFARSQIHPSNPPPKRPSAVKPRTRAQRGPRAPNLLGDVRFYGEVETRGASQG